MGDQDKGGNFLKDPMIRHTVSGNILNFMSWTFKTDRIEYLPGRLSIFDSYDLRLLVHQIAKCTKMKVLYRDQEKF